MSVDRRHWHEPIFDVDPVTGRSLEVFYADRTLVTFGRAGAGWFWWFRQRGFAPEGSAVGPFPTSYSAYRDAVSSSLLAGEHGDAFGHGTHAKHAVVLPYCFHRHCPWKQPLS